MSTTHRGELKIGSILRARCPACHTGPVLNGFMAIRRACPECGYNYHPEPGFYLGAMAIGFFITAGLMVPPLIALKVMDVDIRVLIAWPIFEFIFVGTFISFYCRILWLHVEYRMTGRLDGHRRSLPTED